MIHIRREWEPFRTDPDLNIKRPVEGPLVIARTDKATMLTTICQTALRPNAFVNSSVGDSVRRAPINGRISDTYRLGIGRTPSLPLGVTRTQFRCDLGNAITAFDTAHDPR